MTKKILYIRTDIHQQPLIAGGSVTHTIGVIKGFLQLGYTVSVASSVMHLQLQQLPIKELIVLSNPRWLRPLKTKINNILSNIFFTLQILRTYKIKKWEFLYQRYTLLNCSGMLMSAWYKTPLVLEYNGSEVWIDQNWSHKKKFKKFFMRLAKLCEHINLSRAHRIIVVSDALKSELISRGYNPQKIIVVPNGVDTDEYDPAKLVNERNLIRTELAIENKFVFGFVGTFSPWHGINILQQIIPQIIKREKNVHFLLIGDGPLLNSLKQSLIEFVNEKFITFTGLVPSQIAKNYLSACDAFLSPTQPNSDDTPFFGSPTKLFEYLSLGKPIIASNIGQIADIIGSCSNFNFLVNPMEPQNFVQAAVNCSYSSEKDRIEIGRKAREMAETKYQWSHHTQKIIQSMDTTV